jgi:carboxypeptidase Taq
MGQKLDQLKEILAEIADLRFAAAILNWDQQTYMPSKGDQDRGHQLATLEKLAHVRFTSDEVGRLLEDLQPYAEQLPPESDEACLIKVTAREYTKSIKVTPEWVSAYSQVCAAAYSAWTEARANNDFDRFLPHLEKVVDLRRAYADFFAPYDHIYDPLLDDYETGMKTRQVMEIFNTLRPQQVALIKKIAASRQVEDGFLYQPYDEKKQWDFGVEVITKFGYDWQRGRQDFAPHPFTTHFGPDDVRITTRIFPDFLSTGIFGTIHESGHALYEQGIDPALRRSPLDTGASLAIHESQSRLWENLVGRGLPFWRHFYPRLQQLFPAQLGAVNLMAFYKGINKVQPSLIRVEADEATYNLHIMLRMDLEIALMEGSLQARDLPDAWNVQMQEYLGLTPPDNASGVLQDVHWSNGMIGYFSTYALGNLISLQLWECIQKDIPDLTWQIEQGEFGALLGWLREKIHRHGAKFEPAELVEQVTGSKITPEPYMRYLEEKYGEIYEL